MEFRVLGPVEVLDGGVRLDLGGPKQRTVLALLVANAGQPTSTDALIDGTYGDDAPGGARHSIQTYISNLRSLLGDIITSTGQSYGLNVDRGSVDSMEFADAVEKGRSFIVDDPALAAERLREALAMWRGHPFQDVDGLGQLDSVITRLEELRVVALEARITADLTVGRHRELVGELEALTTEHPLRESFHAQYMTALYRSERQAEALQAFQRVRQSLGQELGIEVSSGLRRLEQQILDHDPALSLGGDDEDQSMPDSSLSPSPAQQSPPVGVGPGGTGLARALGEPQDADLAPVIHLRPASPDVAVLAGEAARHPATAGRPRRRWLWAAISFAIVTATALVFAVVMNIGGTNQPSLESPASVSLAPPISATGAPVATVQPVTTVPPGVEPELVRTVIVGIRPQNSLGSDNAVWFTLAGEGAIARVDPSSLTVEKVAVGESPTIPLVLDGQMWVPGRRGGLLTVVETASLEVVESIQIGERLDTPVFAAGLVWVTAREDFKLVAVDPMSFEVVREFDLPGFPLTPVFAQGGLWVVGRDSGTITRIDPFAMAVSDDGLRIGTSPHVPIVVDGEIWISDRQDGTLTIVDPLTRSIAQTISLGGALSAPVVVEGQVWVSDTQSRTVIVVDARLRRESARIPTGFETTHPTSHLGAFWAADPGSGFVIRIDPVARQVTHRVLVGGTPGVPLSAHGMLWVPDVSGTTVTMIQE